MKATEFNPAVLRNLDTDRMQRYVQHLNFYKGAHWPEQSRHRQLVFNYAKVAIEKLTSFLMQGFSFSCEPAVSPLHSPLKTGPRREAGARGGRRAGVAGPGHTNDALTRVRDAEQSLHRVYRQNNLHQLDYETEIDTAVLGDGCYKVTWDSEEGRIRVTSPDVSGIYAWWLGDDLARVWRVASRYMLRQDELEMLYNRRIEKTSAWITELWTDAQFSLFIDTELVETKPNPYGFIPFIIFPNVRHPKHFWGVSDIPVIMQPQRELNRAFSQLSRILELSGNPIAVLENVTEAEDIKVKPGALWALPEDAKAYPLDLLQGGGVRLHVDYIDHLYRAMHDVSEIPRAAWGGVEKEMSGAALRIELGSLIQKVVRKRLIRTNTYYRRNAMIMRLLAKYEKQDFTDVNHRVVWGPVLPQDVERQAMNEQLLVQAGVHSRRTAMEEMNIQDPDEEFERWLEERRRILEMNLEFRAQSTRGGERERKFSAEPEVPE